MQRSSLCALALACVAGTAWGSSHREAPAIAFDPAADLTDLYAFRTPATTDHHTFIMNVSPAYQSYAGPNWYRFDDDVIYELHIDNTGDAIEDVTYRFQFTTANYRGLGADALIVANFPSIGFADGKFGGALNQTYKVTKIVGNRRSGAATDVASALPVAPPRVGPYTTDNGGAAVNAGSGLLDDVDAQYDNYKALADNAIKEVDGRKFFAGPRNDPFFVDLGAVFDRVSPRIPTITGNPHDALKGANVLTIAFEVPDTDFAADSRYFGVWATTSRPQATVRKLAGQASVNGGGYVQVSRLGNPLVNEAVIKINDKDKFNQTEPKDDAANFAAYVAAPQLAHVLNVLYAGADALTAPNFITAIAETGRTDVVAAFVDGLPFVDGLGLEAGKGINRHPNATTNAGDMLRVNMDFAVQAWPLSGRNLGDDVVHATLAFLAQCSFLKGVTGAEAVANPFGSVAPHAGGADPYNCELDDFVTAGDDTPGNAGGHGLLTTFPYIDQPFSSYGTAH